MPTSSKKFSARMSGSLARDTATLDSLLRVDASFDLIAHDLEFAGRHARLYFVDGFAKDDTIVKLFTSLAGLKESDLDACPDAATLVARHLPYLEVDYTDSFDKMVGQVLSGPQALLIDGFAEAILIDAREYPTRSLQEPENDRVLRGARDSFSETMIVNTSLLRRHIRDPRLTIEHHTVGTVSKTDVAVVYLDGRADQQQVERLRTKLDAVSVKSLTMGQESLAEALIDRAWYNPFPKVRYTERPDAAAATVNEGGIIVITDATPSTMILPTGFFDFFQDTNDYYFPPMVGSYLRLTRYLIYFFTLMLIPTWYLLVRHPNWAISQYEFIRIDEMNSVPIFIQLLIVELIIDCLKQASLNTPSALGNSFSTVAALILGEFAVSAHWFVEQVLLYMGFVAVSNFAQPSFELGYALKLCRIMLLVLIAVFDVWGYVLGLLLILLLIATTPTITGESYLAPLIPYNGKRLRRLILRQRISPDNS
jgi:stage V sporulation protein AF